MRKEPEEGEEEGTAGTMRKEPEAGEEDGTTEEWTSTGAWVLCSKDRTTSAMQGAESLAPT